MIVLIWFSVSYFDIKTYKNDWLQILSFHKLWFLLFVIMLLFLIKIIQNEENVQVKKMKKIIYKFEFIIIHWYLLILIII
jgi:hypothetical protein